MAATLDALTVSVVVSYPARTVAGLNETEGCPAETRVIGIVAGVTLPSAQVRVNGAGYPEEYKPYGTVMLVLRLPLSVDPL